MPSAKIGLNGFSAVDAVHGVNGSMGDRTESAQG